MSRLSRPLLLIVVLVLGVAGCATSFPADPNGTLERVTGGVLRVGVSPRAPFTSIDGQAPSGTEVELAKDYARSIGADIAWTESGEEELVIQLEHDRLDLLIGGLTDQTAWQNRVGLTRPYTETTNEFGQTEKHVMATSLGENAFLLSLDRFLQSQGDQQ